MSAFKNPLVDVLLVLFVIVMGGLVALQYQTILSILHANTTSAPKNYPIVQQTVASVPATQDVDVYSPDGSMKLTMKVMIKKDKTKTYLFTVSDASGNNGHPLFSKDLESNGEMTIPGNSWSPDNHYVFIQNTENGVVSIYVFKASGESFANGQQYFDMTALFAQRNTGNTFKEATGWAAQNLIIIHTTKSDGSDGTSYWFVVDTQGFLPLANH